MRVSLLTTSNFKAYFCLVLCVTIEQATLATNSAPLLRLPSCTYNGTAKECELSETSVPNAAKIRPIDSDSKGKLILGGGGWNPDFYRKPFIEEMIRHFESKKRASDDVVPIILSAAKTSEGAAGGYSSWAIKHFRGKVPVFPIFTTPTDHKDVILQGTNSGPTKEKKYTEKRISKSQSTLLIEEFEASANTGQTDLSAFTVSTSPDDERNLNAIRKAKTAIIVDGGMVANLAHLGSTKLAEELKNAYRRGVTIWASSEGTNALGAVNASLLWPKNIPGANGEAPRIPTFKAGLDVVPFGVSSHVDGPRLIAKYAGCGTATKPESKTENGNTATFEEFTATNPYAFLDPIRQLATLPNSPANYPIFGIPDEAKMTYEKGIAFFESADPTSRFYIFDPRHPTSDNCDYYYVLSGARYDLKSGKVLPEGKPQVAASRGANRLNQNVHTITGEPN